jgi:uncharacterized RDD family membrane protein YckC
MERTVEVATGESIAFHYELAGLGSRFFAVFIDLAIQFAVAISMLLILAWATANFGAPGGFGPLPAVGKTERAIVLALVIFAAFMLFFGYFIVFEWLWEGRTPGKRALGIRVVRDGGFPLDFTSSVIRNLVRILELGFGFYTISAISTLLSPQNRRLGDMAAGTIVVRDRRFERENVLDAYAREGPDDPLVRELSRAERELIRRYVARRAGLGARARTQLAAQIARPIRPKLAANYGHLDDDALLVLLVERAL